MTTALDNVRVQVAFDDDPYTATPTWQDFTTRMQQRAGVNINRGRQDLLSEVAAGVLNCTLDNQDGALSMGLASSPFYPNVKPQTPIRITYRDPAVDGNLLDDESASFEGGTVGRWQAGGSVPPALAVVASHPQHGTKAMRVTWGSGGLFPSAAIEFETVIGRTYTFATYVWVPAGSPAVGLVIGGAGVFGATSTTVNALERIKVTWTATTRTASVQLWPASAPTAGQQVFLDANQADEGSGFRPFTLGSAVVDRYTGYVNEWPTQWPGGGQEFAEAPITASDLQAYLSRQRSLLSVIAETYRLSTPLWHFQLTEPDGAQSAGDVVGSGATLVRRQVGSGGELTFGSSTGSSTDGASAPTFTPVNVTNGLYLRGDKLPLRDNFATGSTLAATFLTPTAAAQTVARWLDSYGTNIAIGVDATGKAVATYTDSWVPANNQTITSATSIADGRTHHASLSISFSAGTATLTFRVDGAAVGTASWSTPNVFIHVFGALQVGGGESGTLFTGTISQVAGFETALATATMDQLAAAALTGFTGETTGQRMARVLSWAGIPAAWQDLDPGLTTVAHVDPTGRKPWQYLADLATTEAGSLFVSVSGKVTFRDRSRMYDVDAPVAVTLPAESIDPATVVSGSVEDVVNTATVTRDGGATVTYGDASSQLRYGELEKTATILSDTDIDAYARAQWMVATGADPGPKIPRLGLDALTSPEAAQIRLLDIGSRVATSTMPSQTRPVYDLRVLGYSESITLEGWGLVANTVEYMPITPMIWDDPTYGFWDAGFSWVY